MKDLLQDIVKKSQGFIELRYHKRSSNAFVAQKGRVDVANHSVVAGVGVRALIDGAWGFAATSNLSRAAIERAIADAQDSARILAAARGQRPITLSRSRLFSGDFKGPGFDELTAMGLKDKLDHVVRYEQELAKASRFVQSSRCRYNEIIEEKAIVTSDGALASLRLVQPELSISAIAEKDGQQVSSSTSAGVGGGWQCLVEHPTLTGMVQRTANLAVELLSSKYPDGGLKTVILAPPVVGLLCHEAIGHTVEADFVKSGSVARGKLGELVGSPLVTMADSGQETLGGFPTGNIPFDDEGVATETTTIIDKGRLASYLHNRESAAEFGVAPTGNARAWLYNDEPLIRMRNTYILPGKDRLDDMIASLEDGYLIDGAGSGQADANGEFMFGCSHVWHIKNGRKVELLREATLSGIAFDVLKTVDAVSSEFRWDLGSGYCGKGQAAKVDAGGPYIRCRIHVGGH